MLPRTKPYLPGNELRRSKINQEPFATINVRALVCRADLIKIVQYTRLISRSRKCICYSR
jgi:hypothetical protein